MSFEWIVCGYGNDNEGLSLLRLLFLYLLPIPLHSKSHMALIHISSFLFPYSFPTPLKPFSTLVMSIWHHYWRSHRFFPRRIPLLSCPLPSFSPWSNPLLHHLFHFPSFHIIRRRWYQNNTWYLRGLKLNRDKTYLSFIHEHHRLKKPFHLWTLHLLFVGSSFEQCPFCISFVWIFAYFEYYHYQSNPCIHKQQNIIINHQHHSYRSRCRNSHALYHC